MNSPSKMRLLCCLEQVRVLLRADQVSRKGGFEHRASLWRRLVAAIASEHLGPPLTLTNHCPRERRAPLAVFAEVTAGYIELPVRRPQSVPELFVDGLLAVRSARDIHRSACIAPRTRVVTVGVVAKVVLQ